MKEELAKIEGLAEKWTPEQVLRWAFETFGNSVAMASGFGAEGVALIDMASRARPDFRVFTLDTEFLFPETYQLVDRIEERYLIKVERVYPELTAEQQAAKHGPALWKRNPDQCCELRKVLPLKSKLATLRAWITAIRRDQTAARASAAKIGWDDKFGLVKINPLADWSAEKVWEYIRLHDVPYNPLHEQNFPSIGCTHCTRAVRPGEDLRDGRWAGFAKTECGLHVTS